MNVSCFVVLQREWQRIVPKLKPWLRLCVVQSMQKSLVCGAFCSVLVIGQAPCIGSLLARFSSLQLATIKKESLRFVFDCVWPTLFIFAAENCTKMKTALAGFAERAEIVGL